MSKRIFALNIVFTIAEFIICLATIMAFAWGSNAFGKWWMLLFCIIPVALYASHGVYLETSVEEKDEQS